MKRLIVLVAFAMLGVWLAIPAIASTITTAKYYGVITISNNSTANSSVPTTFTGNTTQWAANGIMWASGNNTAIRTSSGSDITYMPGYAGNPWAFFVPSIGENTYTTDILYTGGTANMNAKIRYFPGSTGMTIADNPTMEPSSNFTTELSGWFDTSYTSANKTYGGKPDAFEFINGASGNVTAKIVYGGTPVDTLPTGTNDPSVAWTNDANAIDNNIGTTAVITAAIPATSWSAYFEVTFPATYIAGGKYYIYCDAADQQVDLSYYDTGWHNIYTGVFTDNTWETKLLGTPVPNVTKLRLRIYNGDGGAQAAGIKEFHYMYSSPAEVSVSGISSGERTVIGQMFSPFLSLGIDASSTTITPMATGLTLNAPFWQEQCNSTSFQSIDSTIFTMTKTGTPAWTQYGYEFAGSGNITAPAGASWNFAGDFTIEAVVNVDSLNRMIGKNVSNQNWGSAKNNDWIFDIGGDGRVNFYVKGGVTAQSNAVIAANTWYQVVVVRSGNNLYFYVNGADQTAGTPTQAGAIGNTKLLNIGQAEAALDGAMDGHVGELRIYNGKALSAAEVLQNWNAIKTKYGYSGDIYTMSTLASVPNNAYNWIIGYGGTALKYMDTFSFTKGGIERCNLSWEYGTTFTDRTGNGNDGTPSFLLIDTSPFISASLSSFLPITEAKAPAYTLSTAPTFFTSIPGVSGNFTANVSPTYPGHEIITEIAAVAPVPDQLPTMLIFTFILLTISIGMSYAMKTTGVNSLFIKSSIITAIMCVYTAVGIYDVWQTYFFAMMALALMWLSRQREAY